MAHEAARLKPHLGAGSTRGLPDELWNLVLDQLLTEYSLWDLRATVQTLCSLSMTCRDMHDAVQQQGRTKLSRLLGPYMRPLPLKGAPLIHVLPLKGTAHRCG